MDFYTWVHKKLLNLSEHIKINFRRYKYIYKHDYLDELIIYINMDLKWKILDYWTHNDLIYAYVQL